MAVRKLSQGGGLIPEGEQAVLITKVDDTNLDEYNKLVVHIADSAGNTARVFYSFTRGDGTPNTIAEYIYSEMCRAILGDGTLTECDYEDLAGLWVLAEIAHEEYNGRVNAKVKKWTMLPESARPQTAKEKLASFRKG